jgi:hypothetical protein
MSIEGKVYRCVSESRSAVVRNGRGGRHSQFATIDLLSG